MTTWNCRLIKYDDKKVMKSEGDDYYHAIHEVIYDENGKIILYTEDAMDVGGDGVAGARAYYDLLAEAFDAPVLLMSEMPKTDDLPEFSCGLCNKEISKENYDFDGLCNKCHNDILNTV